MTEKLFRWCREHDTKHEHPGLDLVIEFGYGGKAGPSYTRITNYTFAEDHLTIKMFSPKLTKEFLKRYLKKAYTEEDFSEKIIKRDFIQKLKFKHDASINSQK